MAFRQSRLLQATFTSSYLHTAIIMVISLLSLLCWVNCKRMCTFPHQQLSCVDGLATE